ncbi:DNA polymerase subunit gamma-2, mitochondrial [Culex quinquefasciatus]|uniref:DNA polymerase subunit gamma-2, mitochondrial n=1 Tax=Culex quinquefasciatus TaxID=7176 RepID=UPI0018E327E1|nr:DNA polymerase subunit gamma-2, mitochondrial [Culex quinquefasciatus]
MVGGGIVGFRQLLEACRDSKFVALGLGENVVDGFKLSPIGRMLRNNLRDEFRRGEAGTAVYEGSSGIPMRENLGFVKETFDPNVPFGVTIEERFANGKVPLNDSFNLNLDQGHTLSCRYLINPSTSSEFMYKVQRQRKIWWMRYACDPGRFFISDPRQDADTRVQSVAIKSRLGGEELTLEQLELVPADAAALEEELGDFRIKVGRTSSKRIRPSVLRVRQCVEVATLQVVLDAFESGGDASVRIHRKLAPFKCGIVCLSDDPALMPELRDLAKHLCNVLRKANLPVLDCSERNGGRSLAKQLHHLDSIAVPYCLLLRDQCLQNGLFQLRSRDTTLSETIHISDLPQYLLKIVTS